MTAFDAHQDVDYTRRPPVICRDPAALIIRLSKGPPARSRLGMAKDGNGRWFIPASRADRARLAALKARQQHGQ